MPRCKKCKKKFSLNIKSDIISEDLLIVGN